MKSVGMPCPLTEGNITILLTLQLDKSGVLHYTQPSIVFRLHVITIYHTDLSVKRRLSVK